MLSPYIMNMLKPSTLIYITRINVCQTLGAARKRVTQYGCCGFFALLLRGRFEPAACLVDTSAAAAAVAARRRCGCAEETILGLKKI